MGVVWLPQMGDGNAMGDKTLLQEQEYTIFGKVTCLFWKSREDTIDLFALLVARMIVTGIVRRSRYYEISCGTRSGLWLNL